MHTDPYPKYILRNIIISGTSVSGGGNLPSGGTTGQYLRKLSSTDFDTEWSTLNVSKITDLTASATELNYTYGVTSSIQTQLNARLTTSLTSANIIVGNVSNVATAVAMTGDIGITNGGVTSIQAGVIVNADINASAAIAVNKLAALTASRALVSDGSGFASAATTTATEIGYVNGVTSAIQTQLNAKVGTTLTSANILVGNVGNVATAVAVTGDIAITNGGVTSIGAGVIVNADVNASAAIALSKLATVTASKALASDASGFIVSTAVTSTELGYLSGVTAAIQTQLDNEITTKAVNAVVKAPGVGQHGYAITWNNTGGEYTLTDPVVQGIPTGGSTRQSLLKTTNADWDSDWYDLITTDITDISATFAEINILSGATVSTTELNYVDGVSSNIQSQLDAKQSSSLPQNAMWVGNGSNVASALSSGTNGYVLTSVTGVPTWQPASGGIAGLTTNRIPYATSSTTLGDDSAFTWDATNNALTIDGTRILGGGAIANTFVGSGSGNFTTGGAGSAHNVGIGRNAGNALTTGSQNVMIGSSSGALITSGSNNTLVGHLSGSLVTGGNNIFIGYSAGDAVTSGQNNIIIGYDVDAQSATTSNQLSIANAIFGLGNSGTGTTVSSGIISHYSTAAIGSWGKATFINNASAQGTAITDGIVLYAKDSSDGAANSTLALYCEQAPEATGTFTQSHRLKVWINGTEFWLSLDAV